MQEISDNLMKVLIITENFDTQRGGAERSTFELAYCLSDFADWPKLTLAPLTGTATLAPKSSNGGITYWGALSWGAGGAAVGGATGVLMARWLGPRRYLLQLLGGWALAALLLGSLYFFWSLWPI